MSNSDKFDVVVSQILAGAADLPPDDLSAVERRIWLLARLEIYFNMTGFQNFFSSELCFHYQEILACLDEIGASELIGWLEKLKRLYFGDMDIPVDDAGKLEDIVSDANSADSVDDTRVEMDWESRQARLEFSNLFYAHVLSLIESGSLRSD